MNILNYRTSVLSVVLYFKITSFCDCFNLCTTEFNNTNL